MGIGVSIQLSGVNNIGKILAQSNSSKYMRTRDHAVHFLSDIKNQLGVMSLSGCKKRCKSSRFWSSSVHVPMQLISTAAGVLTSNSSWTMEPSLSPYQVSPWILFDGELNVPQYTSYICSLKSAFHSYLDS